MNEKNVPKGNMVMWEEIRNSRINMRTKLLRRITTIMSMLV
jgi:hypothetical protein